MGKIFYISIHCDSIYAIAFGDMRFGLDDDTIGIMEGYVSEFREYTQYKFWNL